MYTLSAVYPTFDVFRMLKNFAFHYIEQKMHILRNMYITYAYMCIIYEEKNEVRRILPSTCKQSQNILANNFVRSLKSFTDPITLVRYFLFGVYSGNCKADMYYTVIIAKVRELRENSISILHNALFKGVSITTITLVMK